MSFDLAHKVAVKIFFTRQDGAPGGHATGAVVERADDPCAAGISRGPHAPVSGRRPGDAHDGGAPADATHMGAVGDDLPTAVLFLDFNDRRAMRRHLDIDQFPGHTGKLGFSVLSPQSGKHQLFAGVLMVDK